METRLKVDGVSRGRGSNSWNTFSQPVPLMSLNIPSPQYWEPLDQTDQRCSDTDHFTTSGDLNRQHGRSRSRDRSSGRRRRKRKNRGSSGVLSDEYSDYHQGGDQHYDYKTQYDSYKYQEPNSTIMVQNLALHLNENDIRQDVINCGIEVKVIRLRRDRDGASQGFAFVEFNSVADATRWMDVKKGVLLLQGQFQANLIYSSPNIPILEGVSELVPEWFCNWCHGQNFKLREFCYICNAPRPEAQDVNLYNETGSYPTTLSSVYGTMANPNIANLLKNFNAGATALAAAQWTHNSNSTTPITTTSVPMPPFHLQHQQHHQLLHPNNPVVATSVPNAGLYTPYGWSPNQDIEAQQGVLDTCRYPNNEISGYYYDPVFGIKIHLDATTRNINDPEKQQFLHLSPMEKKYAAVLGACDDGTSDKCDTTNGDVKRENGEKLDEVKRIAKEMEKWAKSINQKKEKHLRQTSVGRSSSVASSRAVSSSSYLTSGSSTMGLRKASILGKEYVYTVPENTTTYQPTLTMLDTKRLGQAQCDEDDDKTELKSSRKESGLVDERRIACLLCKRKFSSKQVLLNHIKMSDLHKKNLEALRQDTTDTHKKLSTTSYRDRAKERRDQFGSDKNVSQNSMKDLYLQAKKGLNSSCVEEPIKSAIKSDKLGNQMLQKMGLHAGQGLGRDNEGRQDTIMAERRAGKLGLGIPMPENIDEKLDFWTKACKRTLVRYKELD